jgi:hypothetical protein
VYGIFMTGAGKVAVAIASADTIVPVYVCVAVTEFASVAVMAKVYAAGVVGVPAISPVELLSVSPTGNEPAVIANEIGDVPPEVCTAWLYEVFIRGVGSDAVVIASADAIVPLYDCVAVTEFASVAFTVNAYAPAVVGVPPIAPVAAFKLNPAGNVPLPIVNAIGEVPPDVCTVWLYAVFISGTGSVTVVIASADTIVPL